MMTCVKKMFKYIACFLLFVLISLSLYTFVIIGVMKKDYVDIFGYTYLVIDTDSMLGTFDVGDLVFIKLDNDVVVDDIISYRRDGEEIVIHRLVRRFGNKLITKGDANSSIDQAITKDMVIGIVKGSLSLKFIFKCSTLFLISFIFLILINFEKTIKRLILCEDTINFKQDDVVVEKSECDRIELLDLEDN